MDATMAPQSITFPTDLKLLDSVGRKSEQLIDILYDKKLHGSPKQKPIGKLRERNFSTQQRRKVRPQGRYTKRTVNRYVF